MVSELQRVTKAIDWLIYIQAVNSRRELADKMGYTESSLSQILNGKVSLSKKFIKKLSETDSRINLDWLLTGSGSMLKDDQPANSDASVITMPIEVWNVIRDQAASPPFACSSSMRRRTLFASSSFIAAIAFDCVAGAVCTPF